jgi:hypothetical protein
LFLFIAGIEKVQRGAWAFQNPSQPPILWQLDQLAAHSIQTLLERQRIKDHQGQSRQIAIYWILEISMMGSLGLYYILLV